MNRVACVVVAWLVVGISGCPLDLTVPAETIILCDDDADCPSPLVCATRVGRCVETERLGDPAITIVSAEVQRTRMSHVAPFDENVVTVVTAFVPRTIEVLFDGRALACDVDADAATLRCPFSTPDDAVDADLAVIVNASDDLGNVATASIGVAIDVTAPLVLPATVVNRYIGAADNPRTIDGLTAARAGTVVEVGLAFNEPCAAVPDVVGHREAAEVALLNDDDVALPAVAFFVRRTIEAADIDGRYGITAGCADAVGNVVPTSVDDVFVIDNTAPAAVDVDSNDDDDGSVTLLRAPWGRAVDGGFVGAEAHVVRAAIADNDAGLRIDVYGPALLGSGLQQLDGSFDVSLLVGDVRVVEVQVVDGAGNVSARRAVRNVEWTATMGNKVVGSLFENPHAISRTPALRDTVVDPALREVVPTATLLADDVSVVAETSLSWQAFDHGDNIAPQGRTQAAAAYDPARALINMIGGGVAFSQIAEPNTWQHSGRRWQALSAVTGDVAGRSCAGIHDSRRDRFVVAVEGRAGEPTGRVVEFDSVNWREAGPLPTRLRNGALAYDPTAGVAVWFAADGGGTFSFDGATWTSLEGEGPSPRQAPAFGYDDSLAGLVLFGGFAAGAELTDTWLFVDGAWQPLNVSGPAAPSPVFAEDPTGGLLLLTDNQDSRNEVTRFFEGSWETDLVDVDSPRPPNTILSTWVGDPATGDVLRFSGVPTNFSSGQQLPDDTWRFDGHRWRQELPLAAAPPTNAFGSTTDSLGTVMLLGRDLVFPGNGGVGITDGVTRFRPDTGWTTSFPTPRPELGRTTLARRADEVVALGSPQGTTFKYNPVTERFTARNDGAPPAARGVLATLDAQRVLLVGAGINATETWTYDGARWTLVCESSRLVLCPVSPAAEAQQPTVAGLRDDVVFSYDGVTGTTMLFTAGRWTSLVGVQPPPRTTPRMARHAGRDSLVLFGGATNDTWELQCDTPCTASTAQWRELQPAVSPLPRSRHGVVSFGDGIMVVGNDQLGVTFVLDSGDDTRPAVQARFSIAAAGLSGELRSITVEAAAKTAGPGGSGLQLLAWQRGAFATVATTTAAGSLSWSTADPQEVGDSLFGSAQDVIVAVTSDNGGVVDGLATNVQLDAIELRVAYRLPAAP